MYMNSALVATCESLDYRNVHVVIPACYNVLVHVDVFVLCVPVL